MPNAESIRKRLGAADSSTTVLRVIYGGKSIEGGYECHADSTETSSVSISASFPDGERRDVTEQAMEEGKKHIGQFREKLISRRTLYRRLRQTWGEQVFEGTRNCHDNMNQRCKNRGYAKLDSRFFDLADFIHYMGPRPNQNASIHRRNNAKGYSPDNCEWASKKTQSRERTNSIFLSYEGETLHVEEWSERLGVPAQTLRARKQRGWKDSETIRGKRETIVPNTAPWPAHVRESFEKQFLSIGGKTNDDRHAYLLKQALRTRARCFAEIKEDWTYSDIQLSSEEQSKLLLLNKNYDLALECIKKSITELQKNSRHDLLDKCHDNSIAIDELFTRRKRRRNYD